MEQTTIPDGLAQMTDMSRPPEKKFHLVVKVGRDNLQTTWVERRLQNWASIVEPGPWTVGSGGAPSDGDPLAALEKVGDPRGA